MVARFITSQSVPYMPLGCKSIEAEETKGDRTSTNHYGHHGETQHTEVSPILVTNIGP
jgi:hypothetical protein